ncbi:DUF4377 domain-containing protein [Chitinophaga sp. GCM10012297]|uniref:DUF4377 domain-containing protein n=1 Tax=Chitinophaga chungangae TaxID=2821488 RepID=A0ABS3YE12_9BACT|nr:DUF4377 domain-containing protein [Chitinophaga chungangae]MBO9152908.1 DUF4377 domain-containing protein [Chitinophaga chungangae]
MKKHHILVFASVFAVAACQNSPKKAAADSTKTDSLLMIPSNEFRYFEASLPAASSPGRLIGLTLRTNRDAVMTTDYLNATPEIVQIGNWSVPEDSQYLVTLVTVGSGNPVKDTLVFRWEKESLRYIGSDYGTDGLTLLKKEKPAPASKELIVWVKAEDECDRGPGFGKTKCYEVQYGDKLMASTSDAWDKLMEPIEGFTFEKGHLYKLKVNRIPRDPKIQDVGAYEYKLIEVMSKEKTR